MDESVQKQLEKAQRQGLGRAALQAIADRLIGTKRSNFYMMAWRLDDPECGTVGCAIGLCAAMPEVVATGLVSSRDNGYLPTFGKETGTVAVAKAFGMPQSLAIRLFGATIKNGKRGPLDVAERIFAFLDGKRVSL